MRPLEFPCTEAPARGELKEIAPGILWLRMPLPYRLDHINLYLMRHEDGWIIIDTGIYLDETKALWEKIFAQLPAHEPIKAVLCTHSHEDHIGCAGWLTEKLRVPFYMSMGGYFSLRALESGFDPNAWETARFYHRLGFDEELVRSMFAKFAKMRFTSTPPRSYNRLSDNTEVRLGGKSWRVIVGEGHAYEHVSLFCAESKVLICGDQLLPRISANVGVNAVEPEANPLELWLESLDRIGELPADTLVLPSHELPYYGLDTRAQQLRDHHRDQLDGLMQICRDHPGSPRQLMEHMYPRRKDVFDDFLAAGECFAHLAYLWHAGQIERSEQADGSYFFRAK